MTARPEQPQVAELWRYPVKAMRGERLATARFAPDGISGDRVLRVERDGRTVTARTRRDLLALPAAIGDDGEPAIGGERWDSEAVRIMLEGAAPGARLVPTDGGVRFDELPVLVLGRATADELGVDLRRLRPSVVIDGLAPRGEDRWVGREVELGAVSVRVSHRCERCVVTTIDPDGLEIDPSVLQRINAELGGRMGVVGEVTTPGTVRVGDPVRVSSGTA